MSAHSMSSSANSRYAARRLGPAAAGGRNARRGLRGKALGQQHRPPVQPPVAQVERLERFGSPAHACDPIQKIRMLRDDIHVVSNGMQ
jgi:hypothetical protein